MDHIVEIHNSSAISVCSMPPVDSCSLCTKLHKLRARTPTVDLQSHYVYLASRSPNKVIPQPLLETFYTSQDHHYLGEILPSRVDRVFILRIGSNPPPSQQICHCLRLSPGSFLPALVETRRKDKNSTIALNPRHELLALS